MDTELIHMNFYIYRSKPSKNYARTSVIKTGISRNTDWLCIHQASNKQRIFSRKNKKGDRVGICSTHMEGKAKTRRKTWIQVFLNLPSPLLTSQFFVIKILSAVVVINGSWQEQIERDRQTDLKTTTGAEATISLALASAIALDSGLEDDEEAIPIPPSYASYL
jgi:hypothetical protein